ncbi:ANK REP REGION domain-containing protein [Citrus sinensis]|uniref:ANK REP REGION domain-containing protein n=1 Tax=Citrus sinensis TaxID=2711 RepID=A0ACB8M0B9_CITSI|nr:ANK REP REGION domain-containing protein [Citrus sinensis]
MESAAQVRDVDALYELIRHDRYFLDNFDEKPFVDTPLHAAARDGNVEWSMEIIRLKPSFARKLNQDGFSPVQLALQNDQTQLVLQLIDIDPDLVRVQGREGITPLHFVSEKGDIHLLREFLSACPKSLEDVTNKGETALHIALKNDKVESFHQALTTVRPPWLGPEEAQQYNQRILNLKDRDGNTLLHIATSKSQVQIVRCLLNCKVDTNARNSEGLTPLDISLLDKTKSENQEIAAMLREAGALEATSLPITDKDRHLSRSKDQRLNEAAQAGNVDALYELIWEDAYLLDQIDQVPFVDTPLHIAASMGHINFALEIMRLKPSFARKQNQYGFTPLHLALQKQNQYVLSGEDLLQKKQTQMVLRLIDVDRNLVRVQGREGVTPLHYVAEKGNVDLLCKLLAACPESITEVTIRKETALHVAAKNDQLEAVECTLVWLRYVDMEDILNWTDDEGNTLLHITISKSQIKLVKLIVKRARDQINALNLQGKTPMDMVEEHLQGKPGFKEVTRMVRKAGGRQGSSLPDGNIAGYLKQGLTWRRKVLLFFYRSSQRITDENRSALLVVAVLIATATFQAALTPADDLQGNKSTGTGNSVATFGSQSASTSTSASAWAYVTPSGRANATAISRSNGNSSSIPTSDAILFAAGQLYGDAISDMISTLFAFSNITAFCISMLVINYHLPYGSAATLVYPLVICFCLLVVGRTPVSLLASFLMLIVFRIFLFVQLDFSKIRFRRSFWITQVLGSVFKHYGSFRNKMMKEAEK